MNKLSYFECLKAAFNFRAKIKGLGGIPINWLFLGVMAVLSIKLWPIALLAAAVELAYLGYLSGNARFQSIIRAQKNNSKNMINEEVLQKISQNLGRAALNRYSEFKMKCDDVISFVNSMDDNVDKKDETYCSLLFDLKRVFARMLYLWERYVKQSREWTDDVLRSQINALQDEISVESISEAMKKSKQATIDILQRRLDSHASIRDRSEVIESELQRMEQQLSLLKDEVLLARDPGTLSSHMDLASSMLEERTKWLQSEDEFISQINSVNTQLLE